MSNRILVPPPGEEEEYVAMYSQRELENPEFVQRYREAKGGLVKIARVKKIGEGGELSIRPVMFNDLGGATPNWISGALVAAAWTQYINSQLNSAQAVVFFGAFNRDVNQQTTNFRYGAGNAGAGGVKAQFPFEHIMVQGNPVAFHTPVYYLPDEWVQTALYSLAAVTQRWGYYGLIAEKAGEIVKGVLV